MIPMWWLEASVFILGMIAGGLLMHDFPKLDRDKIYLEEIRQLREKVAYLGKTMRSYERENQELKNKLMQLLRREVFGIDHDA